ncbi:MAG: zinc-ribbon domain-containing protein, partial [Pseudomonas stutzeri]|nr:zinc-ribbon domain-containing protein [Pseudomonadales bacterium]NIU61388.1 zinc-ribbon domain-containing protein [Stutzerimonas stutzeri]NIX06971.1 zinc-ribbon domain-containing protein [Pseudomonadales bacterium]
MQCPRCKKQNPDDASFCMKCGARLALVCPQCGTELPRDPDVRFCFKCGRGIEPRAEAPVVVPGTLAERLQRLVPKEFAERLLATRGQVAGERRMVTILFSDVKGSTAMAENLDPEDVMEIMDGAFDVLDRARVPLRGHAGPPDGRRHPGLLRRAHRPRGRPRTGLPGRAGDRRGGEGVCRPAGGG